MAEDVSLTAQAQGAIRAEVANAIIDVLGNGDTSSSLSSAQDTINLQDILSRKLNTLNTSIVDVATKLGDVHSSQSESARQSADAALAAEEQVSPLSRMADTLDDIYGFLKDTFTRTGLGTADDDVGTISKNEKEKIANVAEKKAEKDKGGSLWTSGIIAAAAVGLILKAIKEKLDETWTGVAQSFLKPYVAVQLAIKGLPGKLKSLGKSIGGKFSARFPRLAKRIGDAITKLKNFGTAVGKFFKPVTDTLMKALKPVKSIFKTLFSSVSKLSGGFGFGKLFRFMSPVLAVFKKLALPITLVLEAFEAFKMIFVGSFTKNAQELSDSISKKGILGRAWYGFTHMFQTIATFGYELVDTFKAVITAAGTFMEPIKDGFMNLLDTISSYFIKMYNAIARKSMGLLSEIKTDGMDQMDRREALKRSISGGVVDDARADRMTDQLIDRGAKVGVEMQDGDNMTSFKNRIQAAEQQTKRNEKVQLAREKQKPEYGVGRYKNQGAPVTQNNVQQTIIHEVPPWHPSRQFELGYVPVSP